jgi:hypothetical protein
LVDENKVNDFKLNQLSRQEDEEKARREILKTSDFSTPQGWMQASQKAAKAGYPDLAISLQRQYQNAASAALKNTQAKQVIEEGQLKIVTAISNIIGPAAVTIKQTMQTKGVAMAEAQWAQMRPQIVSQLPPELASRIPATPPKDPQQFSAMIDAAINNSQQAQNILKNQNEFSKTKTAQEAEAERTRHDRVTEATAAAKAANSGFTPGQQDLLAALADKHVSLPSGMRSQADIKAEIAGLIKRHPEMTSDQIADGLLSGTLKFTAESKGAQVAGAQIGKVALAANELDTFSPQVLAASNAIPRGSFVPWSKLQNMARSKLVSTPALLTFKAKMQALENAYNQLAARSGTDADKREHIHELFDAANSNESVQALVTALNQEATAARSAADRTIAETSGSAIPGAGPGAGGTSTATPSVPAAPNASTNGAPSKITSDADYNALPSGAVFIAPDGTTRKKP